MRPMAAKPSSYTVLWNSSNPERARASPHSYTLNNLEARGPMNNHVEEKLYYGGWVRFEPPYFAVIFTSVRTDGDNDYGETAKQMLELSSEQPGFLGFESARQEIGISVSYWASQEAITAWKENINCHI